MRSDINAMAGSYSDDSDGSEYQSGSYYQSSVEVHHTPQREHSINATNTARLVITDETEDSCVNQSGEPMGAVGGADNPTFQVVEDHFCGEDKIASSPSSYSSDSILSNPTETNTEPEPIPEVAVITLEECAEESKDLAEA